MEALKLLEFVKRHFPDIAVNEVEHLYNKYLSELCRELRFGLSSLDVTFIDGVMPITDKMHRIKELYYVNEEDESLVYAHFIQADRRLSDGVRLLGRKLPVWWKHLDELFLGFPREDGILQPIDEEVEAKLYGRFGLPFQAFEGEVPFEYNELFGDYNLPDIALLGILGELYMLVPEGLERAGVYKQEFEREKYKLKKYILQSRTKTYREIKGIRGHA